MDDHAHGLVGGVIIGCIMATIIALVIHGETRRVHVAQGRAQWVTQTDGSTEFEWVIGDKKEQ